MSIISHVDMSWSIYQRLILVSWFEYIYDDMSKELLQAKKKSQKRKWRGKKKHGYFKEISIEIN